jgi:hypothetical protein
MPNLPGEFARISRWLYTSRMSDMIVLSRGKLAAFQACPRRFYLRYQRQMAWPAPPLDGTTAVAIQQGAQFHQLLQRRFLDLPLADDLAADEQLADWHAIFQRHGPKLPPDGRRYVEFTLTAPLGDCLLTGRFDLLLLTADRAHIYDWKTERRPRSAVALREDLQTRLYLALLYEGASALDVDLPPEKIQLTYWYVHAPDSPVTFTYSAAWHSENWAYLQRLAAQVAAAQRADQWPLTDNWEECRRCAYAAYCGREGSADQLLDWEAYAEDIVELSKMTPIYADEESA